QTEAEALARVRHPNVVAVHAFGTHDGQPYFALEYVEGGSLARRLAGQPLPPAETAGLVEPLARALAALHAGGILHRDLKPANVLLASPIASAPGVRPAPGADATGLAHHAPKI